MMRCTPACLCGSWLVAIATGVLAIATGIDASAAPQAPGGTRVRMSLDVAGELLVPSGADAAPLREPVEMTARFDFTESEPDRLDATPVPGPVVRRWYRDATATMQIGSVPTTVTLGADARRILVARRGTTPSPYLADGFLSDEEAELLDTPFDTVLLDSLIVAGTAAIGTAWEIPADVTAGLLAIDTVESGGLQARLEDVSDGRAKISLTGIVDGATDGVPTHVTLEGHWFVAVTAGNTTEEIIDASELNAQEGDTGPAAPRSVVEPPLHELHAPVLQVSAVIRERRQASHVAPGFEVEARLSISREPIDDTDPFAGEKSDATQGDTPAPDLAANQLPRPSGDGAPDRVWYRDSEGRFDLVHDARWRRVEDGANGLVMRLIDHGALVGQCSITSLPPATDAPLPTREDVRRDVERSLAGQVATSEASEEWTRTDGLRVVRIASSGTAGRLPFRWIHYVLAAQDGSRVSVTFMCEESMTRRFSDVDRPLIEGLRLAARSQEPAESATTAAVPDGGRIQTR